jgi:hypothetical protein
VHLDLEGSDRRPARVYAGALGVLVALTLLKFGNPVVLDHKLPAPANWGECLAVAWPLSWAYPLLALLTVWGLALAWRYRFVRSRSSHPGSANAADRSTAPVPRESTGADGAIRPTAGSMLASRLRSLLPWIPLAWFSWQMLSATHTVQWSLTQGTLKHFAAATVCFYLGFFVLSKTRTLIWFGLPVLAGLTAVIGIGFDQHFGGLEATRKFIHSQPDWPGYSAEFLKKISSNRIYSTLFYPNTLAGVLLLMTPFCLALSLSLSRSKAKRLSLALLLAIGSLACLYWSGSKAGWLIALLLILVSLLRTTACSGRLRYFLCITFCLGGLAVFAVKYQDYFGGGAKSVGARLDYWRVAIQIAGRHPWLGSGPGTFYFLYRYLKPPEAEMTRLVHNDYLQQACDSGALGCLLYSLFVGGSLVLLRPLGKPSPHSFLIRHKAGSDTAPAHRPAPGPHSPTLGAHSRKTKVETGWITESAVDRIGFGVWLGLVGWAIQSLVEFGLYIPAMSWPAFLLLGWLWRSSSGLNPIDKVHDADH